jgi:predicted metal-dependent peptidase
MSSNNELEDVLCYLAKKAPFYAMLVQGMVKHVDRNLPTLGVNIKDGKINLYYNPHFMKAHNIVKQAEFLKHECMHIVYDHIGRSKVMGKPQTEKKSAIERVKAMFEQKAENRAADYAINEYLPNLPKRMKMVDKDGNPIINPKTGKPAIGRPCLVDDLKKQFPEVQKYSTAEYYLQFLKENGQKQKVKIVGGGAPGEEGEDGDGGGDGDEIEVDSHDLWEEGDESAEMAKEIAKDAVNKAVQAVGGMDGGNIPSNIKSVIEQLNDASVNWKSVLKRFVAKVTDSKVEFTRTVRNRRFGVLLQGYRREPLIHLIVGIDRSGSVPQEDLEQFLAEIRKIHEAGGKVTVMVCDTKVNEVFEYKPKMKIELTGGGGTLYQPMIDKAKELDADAMIIFGDGDCADTPKKPKFPVLWALTRERKRPANFGGFVRVTTKKNR